MAENQKKLGFTDRGDVVIVRFNAGQTVTVPISSSNPSGCGCKNCKPVEPQTPNIPTTTTPVIAIPVQGQLSIPPADELKNLLENNEKIALGKMIQGFAVKMNEIREKIAAGEKITQLYYSEIPNFDENIRGKFNVYIKELGYKAYPNVVSWN